MLLWIEREEKEERKAQNSDNDDKEQEEHGKLYLIHFLRYANVNLYALQRYKERRHNKLWRKDFLSLASFSVFFCAYIKSASKGETGGMKESVNWKGA